MSKNVVHVGDVEAQLTSDNARARLFARLSLTSAGEEIVKWYNAERKRGEDVTDLLFVVAQFGINLHATFAGQELKPSGGPHALNALMKLAENHYRRCFEAAQEVKAVRMAEHEARGSTRQ